MKAAIRRHINVLVVVVIVLGGVGVNLFWNAHNQDAQRRQGQLIEQKLCSTLARFEPLSGLNAPAGNPATNPSRAYEQKLNHDLKPLAQLGSDVGCRGATR